MCGKGPSVMFHTLGTTSATNQAEWVVKVEAAVEQGAGRAVSTYVLIGMRDHC